MACVGVPALFGGSVIRTRGRASLALPFLELASFVLEDSCLHSISHRTPPLQLLGPQGNTGHCRTLLARCAEPAPPPPPPPLRYTVSIMNACLHELAWVLKASCEPAWRLVSTTQQQWCTGYEPGGCCCSHPSSAREPASCSLDVGLVPAMLPISDVTYVKPMLLPHGGWPMAAGPASRLGSFEPGDKTGLRL